LPQFLTLGKIKIKLMGYVHGDGCMMHCQGKRRRKSNVVYIPMTHVWNFFLLNIYLFILENEIKASFLFNFSELQHMKNKYVKYTFLCVCFCNNNPTIATSPPPKEIKWAFWLLATLFH